MKKQIAIYFIIVLFSCNSDELRNSLTAENLKGKVKSITEIYCLTNYEINPKKTKEIANHCLFNEQGYIVEYDEYENSKKLVEKIIYTYDTNNNLLSKKAFTGKDSLKWELKYSYIPKDSLVVLDLFVENKILLSSTHHRYVNNQILNPIKENKLQFGENVYDFDGNMVERKFYNQKMGEYQYKYNRDNLLTESSYFDEQNNLVFSEIYTYDNYKNLTSKRKILALGKVSEIYKYDYSFDNEGNWISKKEIENGKTVSVIEREIEYY